MTGTKQRDYTDKNAVRIKRKYFVPKTNTIRGEQRPHGSRQNSLVLLQYSGLMETAPFTLLPLRLVPYTRSTRRPKSLVSWIRRRIHHDYLRPQTNATPNMVDRSHRPEPQPTVAQPVEDLGHGPRGNRCTFWRRRKLQTDKVIEPRGDGTSLPQL